MDKVIANGWAAQQTRGGWTSSTCAGSGQFEKPYRQNLSRLDAESLSKRVLIVVGCLYEQIKLQFKHMRDAAAQKQSIAAGKGSVHGSADWVWGYEPTSEWNKEPTVPTTYAA